VLPACARRTLAREELRLQLGTLRFDLNALISVLNSRDAKKKALGLKKSFLEAADELDFAIRKKDLTKAQAGLNATQSSLDEVLAALV